MKTFQENLAGMSGIEDIAKLELLKDSVIVATIENKAGSQGSLRLYRHLADEHGTITPAAAQEGIALYAEHAKDARNHPGKHPNIDRLMDMVKNNETLTARIIAA